MNHAKAEPAVRERDDLVGAARPARVAPGVGDDDDLELEALCAMDREQPNGARALLLGDRFELLRAERLLLADEPHEPREIGAANRLVLASEPAELAQVREAPRPVPAREHCEVVVVLGENALAERLEPDSGGLPDESPVALEERAEKALVRGRETLRQLRARAR